MSGHQCAEMESMEWLTPPEIIKSLGEFDLDPCSPVDRPWDTAKEHFTKQDHGLLLPWHGRVWLNPPYGRMMDAWLSRLCLHGNGIALIFARTETAAFFRYVWKYADAILFIKGRLYFYRPDGTKAKFNSGAPSVLVAYGHQNALALRDSKINGKFLWIKTD